MITFAWILLTLIIVLAAGLRFIIPQMYALKLTPHEETPEKFGFAFEEVHFPTKNDRSLYGWWIPADTEMEQRPTLILVHGWKRNLGRMLRYIEHLHPLNYNLLAFDARHHGSSDEDGHGSMYKFGQDVKSAVDYVKTRSIDLDRIGVIGLSIGGAGSIYAASLEPAIKAVATVGAPAHPVDVMRRDFQKKHFPAIFIWYVLRMIESRIGISYEEFAPVNNIARARAAFLIIHGEMDKVVLPSQGEKLKQAARENQCECWSIPNYGHSNCHHHKDFWERVHRFFQEKLPAPALKTP